MRSVGISTLAAVRRSHFALRILFAFVLLYPVANFAYAQTDRDLQAYTDAINKLQTQNDSTALENFVSTAPNGTLRTDALEWLAWHEWRAGLISKASHWSDELLAGNSRNPVGVAVQAASNHLSATSSTPAAGTDSVAVAQQAVHQLELLRSPYAMPAATFARMKQDLAAGLSGAIGYGFYERKDYSSAQSYLRQYLAIASEDSQRMYALAIADLYGRTRDEAEGYRLLARVVNLTKGTAQGRQLEAFSRQKYKEAGGSDQDWDRYLQVTSSPGSAQVVATGRSTSSGTATASASPAPRISRTTTSSTTPASRPRSRKSSKPASTVANASAGPISRSREKTTTASAETRDRPGDYESATSGMENFPYPTPRGKHEGGPISLGILIETSETGAGNRHAVISNLTDLIRHMGDDDEAFLVSFDDNVVFNEDLTSDSTPLEKAMDRIKPQRGAALLDAIAFASGHLQRIGKNARKILLVVSDGEDTSRQYSSGEAVGSITSSRVEIYCIGMGSSTQADIARLRALARRSGGEAVFVSGSGEFRTATREVASDIGIRLY